MNPEWKQHLERAGAVIEADAVQSFGTLSEEPTRALQDKVLADLSHTALLRVSGEEAMAFLQGQLSNDVRLVSEERSQLTAYCSPKGRALATMRLFKRGEEYYLRLPRDVAEPTLKRLRMFVLRAKVVLEDVSDSLASMGFAGPGADVELASLLGFAPGEVDAVAQAEGVVAMRVPGPHPRFELAGEPAALASVWQRLAASAAPVGPDAWSLLDIQAGVPVVHAATIDAFVPQMINLQLIGGVNFKKGCYPGQEVVARMQYLGKLKRRMYRAHVAAGERPCPGDDLYAQGDEGMQPVGKVVEAQAWPEGGYQMLAVVQIASAEGAAVRCSAPDGPVLSFAPLPYALE